MKLVAIETSTAASSIALGDGQDVVASARRVDRRGHGSFLVPALDFAFDQAGWRPDEIDAVIVDVGPGLYTGIRVGLSTAQGIAAAVGAPVVPVSSLDALALEAATGRRHIYAIVDVRRGEVAVAAYRPVPGGVVREGPPEVLSPERFKAVLESDPDEVLLVGDVPALGPRFLTGLHRVKTGRPRYPSAEALLHLGIGPIQRGDVPHPDEVRPLYLREPDVQINWQAVRREGGPWAEGS